MNKNIINILIWSSILIVIGCSTKYKSRLANNKCNNTVTTKKTFNAYTQQQDSHPERHHIPNLALVSEPEPKEEPKSRYGNPAKYTVLNKTYHVLPSSEGYKERGYASWYGTKFHGFRTSSGEIYDMYAMTAAHKTLPLPTYAKITNLNNNRSIIVKINDRGPFHDNRIVDLSYAAASKLGILDHGVGKVEVIAINPAIKKRTVLADNSSTSLINKKPSLQLGAFAVQANAKQLAEQLKSILKQHQMNYQVNIIEYTLQKDAKQNILYKVMVSGDKHLDIQNLKNILSNIPQLKVFL